MFETAAELWKQYCSKHASAWAVDDPRAGLSAEVRERLEQLDLILKHLSRALKAVKIDPEQMRKDAEWMDKATPLLQSGAITQEEYAAGFGRKSDEELREYVDAWSEVRLFTEVFYLVAWRLREILHAPSVRAFPRLKLEAKSIREVRNLLIEHPEDGRPAPNFSQSLMVTDDGPTLKTSEVLMQGGSGRVTAAESSRDRGLYVNAEEFRVELEAVLAAALI
jgi:hypothetical protein